MRLGLISNILADQIPIISFAAAIALFSRLEHRPLLPSTAFIASWVLGGIRGKSAASIFKRQTPEPEMLWLFK